MIYLFIKINAVDVGISVDDLEFSGGGAEVSVGDSDLKNIYVFIT